MPLFRPQTDLYLELMVERDFREKGGLIFGSHCTAAGTVVGEQIYLFPKNSSA